MAMSRSLGSLVVRIAAEGLGLYKADMNAVADATDQAATKIERSAGRAGSAAGRLNGTMGDVARGAEAVHGAAGLAGVGIGVLVVGMAAASYAAYKGAQEQLAYQKALILTGNAAGTYTGQMADMARAIGQNVGTQYQAASALAAMAGTGQVAAKNLQKVSEVAVEMQRTVGISVADTVKTFAELGQEPVKASMKLNESMNYLTASTFEQIKAAEDLGDKSKAASIAQDAYATAAKDRMTQIKENLGTLERAWNAVGYASKWAYDRMAGIGRDETDGQKLEAIKKRIANAEKPFNPSAFGGNAEDRAQLPMLRAQAAALEGVAFQAQASAQAQADKAVAEKAGIDAITAVTVANTKALTKQQQMTKALEDYRKSLNDIRAVDASSVLLDPSTIAQTEDAIKKQFDTTVRGGRAAVTVYDKLMKSLSEKQAAMQLDLQTQGNLTEVQKIAIKIMDDLRTGTLKLTDAKKINLAAVLESMLVSEREIVATAEKEKANLAAAQAHEKYIASVMSGTDKLAEEISKQREATAELGLSKDAIQELNAARIDEAATTLERKAIRDLDHQGLESDYNITMRQVQAMRDLANAKRDYGRREVVVDEAKKAADEWKKASDQINQSLTDAMMRAFESGKGFFTTLWDSIKNTLKTSVLKVLVQGVVGGVTGMAGMNAVAGQGSSAMSGLGIAGNLATMYSSVSGMVTLGSQVVAGTMSVANALGTVAANATGTGISGLLATNGAYGTAAASSASGIAGGLTSTLAAIPVWGWAALAAVAVASIFGGRGDVESKGKGIEGNFGGTGFTGNSYASYAQDGGWFHSDRNWTDRTALDATTSNALSAGFSSLKASATGAAQALGLSTDAVSKYSESVKVTLTDDAAKNNEIITKMMTDLGDHMASAAAPGLADWAKTGETSSVTLQRLSTSITTANAWLSMLRNRLYDVSMAGADAASKLADAFGSLDNLSASSKAYYETYYTEAERTVRSSEDLAKAMALVNVALPASKDAFRAVVSSLDLTTDAGRNAYAVLLALAPEYAATADATARLAKDTADKLMSTFTGNGKLIPALSAAALKVGDFTGSTTVMSGELLFINSIMGDSTSKVIGFSNGTYVLGTSLSDSQRSAGLLNDQIVALQGNSDKIRIDFVGLSDALMNVNTETFVNTIGLVFENLATRIQGVLGDITTERIAVREAALQIINPTVMGKAQIQSAISGINVRLPSNAGVVSANAQLQQAEQNQAWQKSYSASTVSAYQGALDSAKKTAADLPATYKAKYAEWVSLQQKYGNVFANEKWNEGQVRTAFQYNESTNRLKGYGANYSTWGSWGWSDVNGFNNDPKRAALQGDLQNANYNLEQSEKNVVSWTQALSSVTQQQAALATSASSATAAAQDAAKKAVLDYAASMQNFVIDASKSVGKLSKLREETVKYYEAQKALADLMSTSAAGLRSTVETYRYNQQTPEQQLAELQGKYSTAYSTAMAVQGNGEALAGQGDKLNALLQPLIDKLNETGRTNLVGSYLAQADTVAAMIEAAIPVNYQADSLNMLGSIDATLSALDASSQSAEKIISDAVNAGSDKTAAGLRAIVQQLGGVPSFDVGTNYVPGDMFAKVHEGEAIVPKRYNPTAGARLASVGGGNADVVAELRALRADNANMRAELRAIAMAVTKTAKQGERVTAPGGDATLVRIVA